MLEIDVDVGRLSTLARDEPFEQQLMLDRVDRGDAQQIADAAVGGRSAPLAQDAASPAFRDDRIHGQEIGRIAELTDQGQLMVDLVAVALRDAVGKFGRRRFLSQRDQGFLRGSPLDHLLIGILILDLAEVEGALRGDVGAGLDRIRKCGETALHLCGRFEVAIHEPFAPEAEFVDRAFLADRADDILQRSPLGAMIKDVARRNAANTDPARHRIEPVQPFGVVGTAPQRQCAEPARAEDIAQVAQIRAGDLVRHVGKQDADHVV